MQKSISLLESELGDRWIKCPSMGYHEVKGFQDPSTQSWEKWGVKCITNFLGHESWNPRTQAVHTLKRKSPSIKISSAGKYEFELTSSRKLDSYKTVKRERSQLWESPFPQNFLRILLPEGLSWPLPGRGIFIRQASSHVFSSSS